MYDHVGLKVANLDASVHFYEAALGALGHVLNSRDETGAGFGPKDASALWLTLANNNAKTGVHVAFRSENRADVDRFYAAGLKAGGKDNGGPGQRPDYGPHYYAAFLIDPDGNNVEAVCLAKP